MMPPVDFSNPADARAWLDALRAAMDDVVAAALDATRPFRARVLSRPLARRKVRQGERAIEALLTAAGTAPRPRPCARPGHLVLVRPVRPRDEEPEGDGPAPGRPA